MAPTAVLTVDPAVTVDPATAPQLESPSLPSDAVINRPEVPLAQYRALKESAARGPARPAQGGAALQPLSTTLLISGASGQSQGAPGPGLFPPDSSGASGNTQIAQALNSKLGVYTKANPPALVSATSLATLLGFGATTIFDPRIIHDDLWDRWVLTAEAFPESATVQRQFIAISTTPLASGPWIVYGFDINFTNNASFFWDFPNVGMTQDAIIITGNRFDPGFIGSYTFAVAKAILYNGLGFSVPIFGPLGGTVAPPIVVDPNPNAHLLQILSSTTLGRRVFFSPQSGFYASVSGASGTPAGATISVPPNAVQPGCTAASTCALDSGDARFSSQTWQYGDHLWATHTITSGGLPTPRFYDLDISGVGVNTLKQAGFYFASATSSDFNASIAARSSGRVYVNWNVTSSTTNAQVRVAGRTAADALGTMGPQAIGTTSPARLLGNFDPNFGSQRWGDYSNTWPDNSSVSQAWAFNERVASSSLWGTRLQRFFNN